MNKGAIASRHAEGRLARWISSPYRKPLVIRGARQVGKSTLVRRFAALRGLTLHEVNLERHRRLAPAFESMELDRIVAGLEHASGKGRLEGPGHLLFLDEVQAVPAAFDALRYLKEDKPDLPVIAAGSLLEFALGKSTASVPVGRVEYLFLGPMTFTEVLGALGERSALEALAGYEPGGCFPEEAHARLLDLQRTYLMVGGMPEAVQRFVETGDLRQVSDVHAAIVEAYRDDFAHYATQAEQRRLHAVLDHVATSIGEKVKYSRIDPDSPARDVARAVDLLEMAQILVKAHHTDAAGLPLAAALDRRVFKPYLLDCGLLAWMTGARDLALEDLRRRAFVNEGKLAEQFVAQHLAFLGPDSTRPSLTYWLRGARRGNAEVDFVVAADGEVVPVEVKAGASGTLRSLHQFVALRSSRRAVRFDVAPPSVQPVTHRLTRAPGAAPASFTLTSLPLYMVEQLPRLLAPLRGKP